MLQLLYKLLHINVSNFHKYLRNKIKILEEKQNKQIKLFQMTQNKMKALQMHQNKLNHNGKVIKLEKTKQNILVIVQFCILNRN